MSSTSNKVIITLLYEDDSTRNYTFENVQNADLANVKDKIIAINENFYKTFVSIDGEAVINIESCKIVVIEEEVIYSG